MALGELPPRKFVRRPCPDGRNLLSTSLECPPMTTIIIQFVKISPLVQNLKCGNTQGLRFFSAL